MTTTPEKEPTPASTSSPWRDMLHPMRTLVKPFFVKGFSDGFAFLKEKNQLPLLYLTVAGLVAIAISVGLVTEHILTLYFRAYGDIAKSSVLLFISSVIFFVGIFWMIRGGKKHNMGELFCVSSIVLNLIPIWLLTGKVSGTEELYFVLILANASLAILSGLVLRGKGLSLSGNLIGAVFPLLALSKLSPALHLGYYGAVLITQLLFMSRRQWALTRMLIPVNAFVMILTYHTWEYSSAPPALLLAFSALMFWVLLVSELFEWIKTEGHLFFLVRAKTHSTDFIVSGLGALVYVASVYLMRQTSGQLGGIVMGLSALPSAILLAAKRKSLPPLNSTLLLGFSFVFVLAAINLVFHSEKLAFRIAVAIAGLAFLYQGFSIKKSILRLFSYVVFAGLIGQMLFQTMGEGVDLSLILYRNQEDTLVGIALLASAVFTITNKYVKTQSGPEKTAVNLGREFLTGYLVLLIAAFLLALHLPSPALWILLLGGFVVSYRGVWLNLALSALLIPLVHGAFFIYAGYQSISHLMELSPDLNEETGFMFLLIWGVGSLLLYLWNDMLSGLKRHKKELWINKEPKRLIFHDITSAFMPNFILMWLSGALFVLSFFFTEQYFSPLNIVMAGLLVYFSMSSSLMLTRAVTFVMLFVLCVASLIQLFTLPFPQNMPHILYPGGYMLAAWVAVKLYHRYGLEFVIEKKEQTHLIGYGDNLWTEGYKTVRSFWLGFLARNTGIRRVAKSDTALKNEPRIFTGVALWTAATWSWYTFHRFGNFAFPMLVLPMLGFLVVGVRFKKTSALYIGAIHYLGMLAGIGVSVWLAGGPQLSRQPLFGKMLIVVAYGSMLIIRPVLTKLAGKEGPGRKTETTTKLLQYAFWLVFPLGVAYIGLRRFGQYIPYIIWLNYLIIHYVYRFYRQRMYLWESLVLLVGATMITAVKGELLPAVAGVIATAIPVSKGIGSGGRIGKTLADNFPVVGFFSLCILTLMTLYAHWATGAQSGVLFVGGAACFALIRLKRHIVTIRIARNFFFRIGYLLLILGLALLLHDNYIRPQSNGAKMIFNYLPLLLVYATLHPLIHRKAWYPANNEGLIWKSDIAFLHIFYLISYATFFYSLTGSIRSIILTGLFFAHGTFTLFIRKEPRFAILNVFSTLIFVTAIIKLFFFDFPNIDFMGRVLMLLILALLFFVGAFLFISRRKTRETTAKS